MAFETFDIDPITGLVTKLAWDGDGKMHVRYEQDVTPYIDYAKAISNEGLSDAAWRKQEAATYAVIPPVVQKMMRDKGIRIFDPEHIGRVLAEINTNYPWLKCTSKTHAAK